MNEISVLSPAPPRPSVVFCGHFLGRLAVMNEAARGLRMMGIRVMDECLNVEGHRPIITIEVGGAHLTQLFSQSRYSGTWEDKGHMKTLYRDALVMWRVPV